MTVIVHGHVEYHPDEEVCPWCGGFFASLVAWSGWCSHCTAMFVGQAEPTAHCSACDVWKPASDFGARPDGSPRPTCRPCETRKRQEWREANPEKNREATERAKARRHAKRERGTVAA